MTESARAASGMAGAALGASYVVRAVGDVGSGTLTWVSPLGWAQSVRPYADERWWTLGLLVVGAVVLLAVALALEDRRDFAAGLVRPRPGPARAGRWADRPFGLALRLQRGAIVAWSSGLLLTGVAYGAVGNDVEDLAGSTDAFEEVIAQGGGDLVKGFLATAAMMLALIGAGGVIQIVLRMRGEELSGRAEPLLATATSRRSWLGAQLGAAALGAVSILAAAGFGMGLAYGIAVSDMGQVPRLVGAVLAHTPAMAVLAAAAALFGAAPRITTAVWALLVVSFIVGFFGELLRLPSAVRGISPFHHVPMLPSVPFQIAPLLGLLVVAALLAAVGFVGLDRRDLHAS